MVLINDLFQEAVQRCGDLSAEMDKAEAAIETLLAKADALGSAVASKSDEAHRHFQELTARLAQAEDELEQDGQQAQSRLSELGRRAGEVQGRVGELLQAVEAGMTELAGKRAELEGLLESQTEAADTNLDALGQRIHALEESLSAGLEQAETALKSFSSALNDAREDWDDRLDDLVEEMDRVEDSAHEQTQGYVSGIEGAFNEEINVLVDELANDLLIEPHNQAVEGLMQKFTEEAKGQVAEALGPVRQAMEALGEMCTGEQGRLQQNAADILKKAEGVIERLERLRPALALASRLG